MQEGRSMFHNDRFKGNYNEVTTFATLKKL